MEQVRLKISGHVQGVFFRDATRTQALLFGLRGWVKNTHDGGVETLVQGPKEKLEAFIGWCKKGPPAAGVENIEISWEKATELLSDFEIR